MLRVRVLFALPLLFVALTIALLTCNVSYWVDSTNSSCSSSVNRTNSHFTVNDSYTLSPDDHRKNSCKLIIYVFNLSSQRSTKFGTSNMSTTEIKKYIYLFDAFAFD